MLIDNDGDMEPDGLRVVTVCDPVDFVYNEPGRIGSRFTLASTAAEIQQYCQEIASDPRLQAAVNHADDAGGRGRTFEPTDAERQRFREMCQNEYTEIMYGGLVK